jgi:predicted glutamate--cysteine ligase
LPRLLKGFEVEVFTGRRNGEVVGLSDRIVERLPEFVREPDSRNVEFITPPLREYEALLVALLRPRRLLRQVLGEWGDYVIVPGSTMPLAGATKQFYRSHPGNKYHDRIEETYGTKVVTASIHINFGVDGAEHVMAACRLLRLEAAAALAVSASSPFLEGEPRGHHSTRWSIFPKTPPEVPIFESHRHYIAWVHERLADGQMWNVRHLWAAARPNGPQRPEQIDRVELRITDVILDPRVLLGLTHLLEVRLQRLLSGDLPEPLSVGRTPEELRTIADRNEIAAAHASLDAELVDWRDGRTVSARHLVSGWLEEARLDARGDSVLDAALAQVARVLEEGNQAMRWIRRYRQLGDVSAVMTEAITECAALEDELMVKEGLQ